MTIERTTTPPGVLSLLYHLRYTGLSVNADKNKVLKDFRLSATEKKVFSKCGDMGHPDDGCVANVLYLTKDEVNGRLFKITSNEAPAPSAGGVVRKPGLLSFLYHLVHTAEVYNRFHPDDEAHKNESRSSLMSEFELSERQKKKLDNHIARGPTDDGSLEALLDLAVPELNGDAWYKAW
ncbi:hypothetical protein WMF45_32430 [Sorangium sp. So ce448]|uniref:hypothetical protein n=1 Tax=Sorangium sp. So ce448 TaxID=3133314 RepID=UPI003F5D6F36